jgi:MFS family permease
LASKRWRIADSPDDERESFWHPLRTPVFRNLLAANVVSDMGAFMQTVGAAWLMVSLHACPLYAALIQTASALPSFVFALPAGAIGDIVDRRRLFLVTEIWMLLTAVVIAGVTIAGAVTPWLLLALTFALSAADAVETPTTRARYFRIHGGTGGRQRISAGDG